MNSKGQASMETLLILAAAVFMAAMVGLFLKNLPKGQVEDALRNQTTGLVGDIANIP